jgi:asparagine synthase (glutamine-hydrolysing)
VLTGEGSDELMAGYARYRKTVFNLALGGGYERLAPGAARRAVAGLVSSLGTGSRLRQKLERTFLCRPADLDHLYFDNFAVFPLAAQRRLLTPETVERAGSGADPYAGVRRVIAETDASTLLNRLLYADTKTYLHELLMKQDQMSMAASIESRVPFLDHKLVEFTARLPERLKLRGWTTKYVLRRAMKNVLPEAILTRSKMGFPVPLGSWLRGRHRGVLDEYVTSERARERGIFDAGFVGQLVAEHVAGVCDHSPRLWALINFEVWLRRFFDGEPVAEPQFAPVEAALAT